MASFYKHFLTAIKLSLSLTLGSVSSVLLTLEDSWFAFNLEDGTYEALLLVLPIVGLNSAFGAGVAGAIGDMLAKSKTNSEIKNHYYSANILILIYGIVCVFTFIFAPTIIERICLGSSSISKNTYVFFVQYWKIIQWCFPIQAIFALNIQVLNVLKLEKLGLLLILFCNIINIVLDYLFTMFWHFGIQGLAYSTISIFSICTILSAFRINKELSFNILFIRPFLSITSFQKLSINSFLIFLSIGIFNLGGIIFNHISLSISQNALIIYGISSQIRQVFSLITRGFSGGFLVQFGTALKQKHNLFAVYWASTIWIAIVYLIGCIFMTIFPEVLLKFWGPINPQLIMHTNYFLFIGGFILLSQILPRMAQVGFLSLNYSYLLVLQSFLLVLIESLIAYQLVYTRGVKGIIEGQLLGNIIIAIVFTPIFFFLIKKKNMVKS